MCIYGDREEDAACASVSPRLARVVRAPGDHHFDGHYGPVGRAILNSVIVAALETFAVPMAYNALKAATIVFAKQLSQHVGQKGIRVNSVHPGWMSAMRTSVSSADPEQRKKLNSEVPLKRSGTAEEAAQAVLFLASVMIPLFLPQSQSCLSLPGAHGLGA